MKKKLSICMMVKNEERNLKRCLDSLQELMSTVPSELIIVDTGSEDNTVAIAKQYTDQVFFHPWTHNFSEMRNISIGYAKGEWILIIDADEEITISKPIIDFLNTKQPRSVVGAAMLVKNLTKEDSAKHFAIINSARVFRNNGNFRYEGAIHNTPVIKGVILTTNGVIVHYGYISTDPELMERKFQRTSTLLKNELEKDPDNIYYRFQLSVSYLMHKDEQESLDEIRKAYDIMKDKGLDPAENLYVYYQFIRCCLGNHLYEEAERIGLEGIQLEKEFIDLYFYLAQAQAAQQKYEETIQSYLKYLELINNFDNLAIKYNPKINHYSLGCVDEAYYNLAVLFYKTRRFKEGFVYVQLLWSHQSSAPDLLRRSIPTYVEMALHLNRLEELGNFYTSNADPENKTKIENNIEKYKDRYSFADLFSLYHNLIQDEGVYGILNKARAAYLAGQVQTCYQHAIYLAENYDLNDLADYYGDLLYFLIKTQGPLEKIMIRLTENNAIRFLKYLDNQHSGTIVQDVAMFMARYMSEDFAQYKTAKLLGKYLVFSDQAEGLPLKEHFYEYINHGILYLQQLYSSQIIDNELIYELKNVEEVFLLYVCQAMRKEDKLSCIQYLGTAAKIYPDMKSGIILMLEDIQNEKDDEMSNLKEQLTEQIRALISNGDYQAASQIVEEYEKHMGKDLGILNLKADILLRLH